MKVAIGNDHAGLELKQYIVNHLKSKNHVVIDVGTGTTVRTHSAIYALKVTTAVNVNEAERGILICGTGVGMTICANKVNGIRAVMGTDPYTVEQARRHNDTNVLTFGGLTVEKDLAIGLVDLWLSTDFENDETRQYRLSLIDEIEMKQST